VGNPTVDEVRNYLGIEKQEVRSEKLIALLAGSRKQEIKDNLPTMLETVKDFEKTYHIVVAGAPGIEPDYYRAFMAGSQAEIVFGKTYDLLARSHAALVTSGTATLEACLFRVPQVVCYKLPLPKIASYMRKRLIKVKYISLVNLIADREVVTEVLDETYTVDFIRQEFRKILDGPVRQTMLDGYDEVKRRLGDKKAPDEAARMIHQLLNKQPFV
jgi:lipid-A-disaccharide synthase